MKPFHQFHYRRLQTEVSSAERAVAFFLRCRAQCGSDINFFPAWFLFFVRRRQFLLVCIDHEHRQQLRGFGLACVLTNAVPVTGHLGEALPGTIGNDRSIIDKTPDRSFENGCVDESRLGMRVGRRHIAGTIFDEYTPSGLELRIRFICDVLFSMWFG